MSSMRLRQKRSRRRQRTRLRRKGLRRRRRRAALGAGLRKALRSLRKKGVEQEQEVEQEEVVVLQRLDSNFEKWLAGLSEAA